MLIDSVLPSRRQAVIEVVFAAAIWGFGFVAIHWTVGAIGPLWLNGVRFLLGGALCFPLIWFTRSLRVSLDRTHLFIASFPGLLLGAMLILQTYGVHYTTVTRAGFITVLYVVFVPMLERALFGTRLSRAHALWVGIALVGAALICQLEGGAWNLGDSFVLAGALCGALQIVSVERVARRIHSPFVFNFFQCLWASLPPLVLAPIFEAPPTWPLPPQALAGLLVLTLACTLIAFLIQIRGQRVLAPSLVSMLFLLESPFAAASAYLVLGERLTFLQWLGAFLILGAAAGTLRNQPPASPSAVHAP